MFLYVLYTIHVVISIFLILVVLLQQGKGADLSVFGGGATQAAFGARGAATVLHKSTVACFVMFILTTLSIGLMQARSNPSLMRGVDAGEGSRGPASELAGGELEEGATAEGAEDAAGTAPTADGEEAASEPQVEEAATEPPVDEPPGEGEPDGDK